MKAGLLWLGLFFAGWTIYLGFLLRFLYATDVPSCVLDDDLKRFRSVAVVITWLLVFLYGLSGLYLMIASVFLPSCRYRVVPDTRPSPPRVTRPTTVIVESDSSSTSSSSEDEAE